LAAAIDVAFARWDRAHLYQFQMADARRIGQPEFDDVGQGFIDGAITTLNTLGLGEQFVYGFDFGDSWTHLCTVEPARIDPYEVLGTCPAGPQPFWGWGEMPDQYGRRFDGDDGEMPVPPDPGLTDLPPLLPWWGPRPD
jgi:hypothetical protein